jgi:hypothetical protein
MANREVTAYQQGEIVPPGHQLELTLSPRVRISAAVCCVEFRFRGMLSSGRLRQLLHMRKSRSLLPLMMVRGDASKPVHKLANIDPSGSATVRQPQQSRAPQDARGKALLLCAFAQRKN